MREKTKSLEHLKAINPTSSALLDTVNLSSEYLSVLLNTLATLDQKDAIDRLTIEFPALSTFDAEHMPTLPLRNLLEIYATAGALVNGPGLSISTGRKLKISSHGSLSNLLISAPNLKTAIEALGNFYHLKAPFLAISLVESGNKVTVFADLTSAPGAAIERVIGGVLAGGALNIFEFYGLEVTSDISLYLSQLSDEDIHIYERFLGLRPQRGQRLLAFKFPQHYLRTISPLANRELFELAVKNCQLLQDNQQRTATFSQTIETLIMATPAKDWSQTALAEYYHISESTLRRRFARDGTSCKEVVNTAKIKVAQSLLLQPNIQITAVSLELGFSDPSNFASVFKRHTGLSPRNFRNKYLRGEK